MDQIFVTGLQTLDAAVMRGARLEDLHWRVGMEVRAQIFSAGVVISSRPYRPSWITKIRGFIRRLRGISPDRFQFCGVRAEVNRGDSQLLALCRGEHILSVSHFKDCGFALRNEGDVFAAVASAVDSIA